MTTLPGLPDPALPKILQIHPGASWSTADVHNGLRFGLSALGVRTSNYQMDVRIARSGHWLNYNWRKSKLAPEDKPNARDIGYHASIGALERALRHEPDWILIVSAMYFELEVVKYLRRCGFKIAVLLTESPYDDLKQAEFIRNVDIAWTNERSSVARLQAAAPRTRVRYLPPAWHPMVHVPMALPEDAVRHDVCFVGTAFPERNELLAKVRWPTENVGFYGHWTTLHGRSRLRRFVRDGVVDNERAAWLYRGTKVNLNLMRKRVGFGSTDPADEVIAESVNPRCMELAALGCFFVSDPRPELDELFGNLVPTFSSAEELSELLRRWLDPSEDARRRDFGGLLTRFVQGHSWVDRARTIVEELTTFASPATEIELDGAAIMRAAARAVPAYLRDRDEGVAPV